MALAILQYPFNDGCDGVLGRKHILGVKNLGIVTSISPALQGRLRHGSGKKTAWGAGAEQVMTSGKM
jgi:hypothetical protein